MKQKKPMQLVKSKKTINRNTLSRKQLKQSVVLAVILMAIVVVSGFIPPVYITLDEGHYRTVGVNGAGEKEWIRAGSAEEYTEGRFFKIDSYSYLSGKPARDYEVIPTGFPVSCAFAEELWYGEFGVYAVTWTWLLIDFAFWLLLSIGIVFYFYPKAKDSKRLKKLRKKQ